LTGCQAEQILRDMEGAASTRIVVLTRDGEHSRFLCSALAGTTGLAGIVLEEATAQSAARWIRRFAGRRATAILRSLYVRFRRGRTEHRVWALEEQLRGRAMDELCRQAGPPPRWPFGVPVQRTSNIHGAGTLRWLRRRGPELIVTYGCSILREPLLSYARRGALNVHPALLPECRGTAPRFWQLLHNDFSASGATVHVVTAQVDAGDIVLQKAVVPAPGIDVWHLQVLTLLAAIEILPVAVQGFLNGTIRPQAQGQPSTPLTGKRDVTLERRILLLRRLSYEV
jgi:hypothetical protein